MSALLGKHLFINEAERPVGAKAVASPAAIGLESVGNARRTAAVCGANPAGGGTVWELRSVIRKIEFRRTAQIRDKEQS